MVHASGDFVASADNSTMDDEKNNMNAAKGDTYRKSAVPTIRVWSLTELVTIATIRHAAFKSSKIVAINFLPESVDDHELLLLANNASPFIIFVLDWRKEQLLAHLETSHSHFRHVRFHIFDSPFENASAHDDVEEHIRVAVVTAGKHHLSLWRFTTQPSRGGEPYRLFHIKTVSIAALRNGKDREHDRTTNDASESDSSSTLQYGKPTITAVACDFHGIILGDSDGTITVWRLPSNEVPDDHQDDLDDVRSSVAAIPLDDESELPENVTVDQRGEFRITNEDNRMRNETLRQKAAKHAPERRHRMFQLRNAHEKPVVSLCFFNDGTLISASSDNEIRAWDTMSDYQLVKSRSVSFHKQ